MIRKGSLSEIILIALENAVDGAVRLEDFTYNTHFYALGDERPLPKSALSQAINRLRGRGLVSFKGIDGGVLMTLTQLGELQIKKGFNEEEWDGKTRVVVFDIPENRRVLRRSLRILLRRWGFEKYQLSVWVNKSNITQEFKQQIKKLGLDKWVVLFETDSLLC